MSATQSTTESNTEVINLEIKRREIKKALEDADRRETLELIRDIATAGGVLSDELRERFEQHVLYTVLSESDKGTLNRALEAGVKRPLRRLLVDTLVVYRGGAQLKWRKPSWGVVSKAAVQLLTSKSPHTSGGTKRHKHRARQR